MAGGRPAIFDKAETLQEVADKYFAECDKGKKRPTITGLAYSLGFESRQSFYDYEDRNEFSYIIKRLRLKVETGYEEALSLNNCTGAIFALKNMGWKDKTEQDLKVEGGVVMIGVRSQDNTPIEIESKVNGKDLVKALSNGNGKGH